MFKKIKLDNVQNSSTPKIFIKYTGNPFSGIFDALSKQYKGNICVKNIISIDGNIFDGSPPTSSIVDFNHKGLCYNSKNQPNSYICFDFKNSSISVSSYTIKSSNHTSPDYLQTWVLEGSNNKKEWITLDMHENDKCLASDSKVCVFSIKDQDKSNQRFKFIQLRMTGESIQGHNYLDILNIEFFGKYY